MFFPGRSVIKGSPGFLPVALKTPLCSAYAIAAEPFPCSFLFFFPRKYIFIFLHHMWRHWKKMYELNAQKDRQ